jgi:organic radical activating enzyme
MKYDNRLNIADYQITDVFSPKGDELVIWVQGCSIATCVGCNNKAMQNPAANRLFGVDDICDLISENRQKVAGINLMGGEPTDQSRLLIPVVQHAIRLGLRVTLYTGWEMDEILESANKDTITLCELCDLVITGRYDQTQHDAENPFYGSKNQVIIANPNRPEMCKTALEMKTNRSGKRSELIIRANYLSIIGFENE